MKFLWALVIPFLVIRAVSLSTQYQKFHVKRASNGLQDIVTYDEHSLMVYGERIMIYSGEFHAYRLPVPDLWIDIFEKIKALGFSAVSFYTNWALLEGEPGVYRADGVFALEPFFEAAKEAGIYLIARPGPYINAEVSGGGFPGWMQRVNGILRTRAPDYLAATNNYVANVAATIAKYQITNGGPVILLQVENEYSVRNAATVPFFPDPIYMSYIEQQYRDAGIIVPFINNDVGNQYGYFGPGYVINGTTEGDVDVYSHDIYPLGFKCGSPSVWAAGALSTSLHDVHMKKYPSIFYALGEYQGGSMDAWGGWGYDNCAAWTNMEFMRIFVKNNFAAGAAMQNLYMIYGGTNWGNMAYPGVYTSYDYGSAIKENRAVSREKYSELKLQGTFLKVSPALLTASAAGGSTGIYTDSVNIWTTPLFGNGTATNFYLVRHSDYQALVSASYTMKVSTSKGNLTVPQLTGSLSLNGRDSKWFVTDYAMGNWTLLYSSAEILTWQTFDDKTVLLVYGGPGEQHELGVITSLNESQVVKGNPITSQQVNGTMVLNWQTSTNTSVVKIGDLFVYLLDRNSAYNYWVPDFKRTDKWGAYTTDIGHRDSVIVQAGYLIRKAYIHGTTLNIEGDLNATVPISIIGASSTIKSLHFNGNNLLFTTDPITGEWTSTISYTLPSFSVPDLTTLDWRYIDNLPEIQDNYDDSLWTVANLTITANSARNLTTPVSLYASDYGYNTGAIIFRGHFTATGSETTLTLGTQGGLAYGMSAYINSTYLGSWAGTAAAASHTDKFTMPTLTAGASYVITVILDNTGLNEDWTVGTEDMKAPRGILSYSFDNSNASAILWKLAGNLGGESYFDKVRGPLNEGGLYAERQGFTQPSPPCQGWNQSSPFTGISTAGIALYHTTFNLDLPRNYDIPLSFSFSSTVMNGTTANYQAQLYINGWNFGKYINNIGPQHQFPVPQGILNYHGPNSIAVEIWARQANGAKLTDFQILAETPIQTSMNAPKTVNSPSWSERPHAY